MANINFEFLLGNFSFVILFFIMILYWVQAIFSIIPKFHLIIFLTTLSANLTLLILLVLRWSNYGHFPLSNLYESLLFLSWSFTLIELLFIFSFLNLNLNNLNLNIIKYSFENEFVNTTSSFKNDMSFHFNAIKTLKQQFKNIDTNTIIGTVLSPIAFFTNSFATFSLPKSMQQAQALVPALQSNWLMMHVTVMMLSYAALLSGSLLAITFLVITWNTAQKTNDIEFFQHSISTTNEKFTLQQNQINKNSLINLTSENKQNWKRKSNNDNQNQDILIQDPELPVTNLAKILDNLSYRILGIGFPLLTIGILSGAVWANEAWGSYWSWDPKETWAFITWLIFAIYLHIRITKGWEGKKPAMLASFGFFIVWICYLGVNILGTGLHSYGWIKLQA